MAGGRFINRMFLRDDGVVLDDMNDEPIAFLPTVKQAQELRRFSESMLGASSELQRLSAISSAAFAAADVIANQRQAASFLQMATLGPTLQEINDLVTLGSKRAWILDQFNRRLSRRYMDRAYFDEGVTDLGTFSSTVQTDRAYATAHAVDSAALRTKLTWCLSKLFVVSFPGGAFGDTGRTYQWLSWLDRLDTHVFGNWRDLIESVTYSLHMARMLSFYGNAKESGSNQPDENYAREIMQLFSIGLFELNRDGTYKLDENGQRIPTYNNTDIRQVARCLTGLTRWDFNGTSNRYDVDNSSGASQAVTDFATAAADDLFGNPNLRLRHYLPFYEYGSKKALGGRVDIPAGTDPETNLSMLHDALFNHPNTAPFFAVRMIQHLVTSNPSPGYVSRVVEAFEDNGQGVRGDLKAVWLAILTDPEANEDGRFNRQFGRVRDGYDLWMNMVRSLERRNSAGRVSIARDGSVNTYVSNFGPTAFRMQPSIFSAYDPLHIPGELAARGSEIRPLVAPEMQMWSDILLARAINELIQITVTGEAQDTAGTDSARSSYSMLQLTGTAAELVERLNILLCGGAMGLALRQSIESVIGPMPTSTATEQNNRVAVAMQLVVNSPDFMVQL
jgi:hypothetical protein